MSLKMRQKEENEREKKFDNVMSHINRIQVEKEHEEMSYKSNVLRDKLNKKMEMAVNVVKKLWLTHLLTQLSLMASLNLNLKTIRMEKPMSPSSLAYSTSSYSQLQNQNQKNSINGISNYDIQ